MSEIVTNLLETIEFRLDNIEYFIDLLEENNVPVDNIREHMSSLQDELSTLNERYENTHE